MILSHTNRQPIPMREFAEGMARQNKIVLSDETEKGKKVEAYVNAMYLGARLGWQGRWICRCPDPNCGGAEYVDFDDMRFMCLSCFNQDTGHRWIEIAAPKDRIEIEAVLEMRPGRNRHWKPGETVDDLIKENKAHGLWR